MGMRVCVVDGCWQPTAGTRCTEHERAWQRARNLRPARVARRTAAFMAIPLAGHTCACCGTSDDLTRHHVEPLARGNAADHGPLIPMCRRCNSSIGAKRMAGLQCPLHGGVEA